MEQLQEKHDSTLKEMVIRADMPAEFNSRTLRQKDRRIRELEKVVQQLREKYADLEEEHETVLSGLNSPRDDDMRSSSPPMSTLHQRTLSDELSAVRLVGSSSPELGLARSAAGSGGRAASAEPSPMAPRAAVRSSSQGTPSSSQLSPLVPTGNPWLSMSKHISTLQEEKTALKEEAAQLRAKAQQADEQLAAAQTRVAQLEGECGELRSQKALQDGEVQALTAELAVRQADKAQLEARVGELDGRARNMGESVAALEVELKIERAQQAERAEEVARLKREMQALQAERTEMENRYAELMCECHSYRANVDELQGLCAELAAARQALETRLQAAESGQGQEQAAAQELRNLLRQAELDSRHEREKCKLRIDALQREVNDLRRLKDEHAREREQDKNQMLAWDHSLTLLAERLSGSGRGSGEEGGVEGGADGEVEAASAAARGGVEAQMAAAMAEAQRRIASELQQLQQRSREQRSELAAAAASTLDRLQAQFASDRRAVTELEGKYKQAGEALRKRLERDMADMRAASQDWQQRALQVQQENVRLLQTVNAREADVQRLKQQVQDLLRDGRRGEDGKGGVGQGRGAGTAAVDGLGPLYDELDRLRREVCLFVFAAAMSASFASLCASSAFSPPPLLRQNLRLQAESAGKARVEEGGGRWGEGEAALALLGGLLLVLLLLQLVVSISSVPGDSTNSASIAGRLLGELGLWLRRGSELLWPA